MKIKNKFIIPIIAILVALLMTGGPVATVAADTEASSDITTETTTTNPAWTHDYTYKTTTVPPTSSLEEEIEGAVSDILGDDAGELGGPIRDTANITGGFLRMVRNFIDKIIEFTKKIGDFLAGFTLGDLIGGLTTTAAPEETTTAAQ